MDPTHFTRGTSEVDVDTFNQWLRSQPFWQQIRGSNTGDLSDGQKQAIKQALAQQGIQLPKDFTIDKGGNINQKNRLQRNLIIGGAIGAAALGIPAAFGAFGGAAGAGGAAAASGAGAAGAGAGGAAAGGGLLSSLIVPTLIKGGGDLVNGIIANKAAGKAASQLESGVNHAQEINKQVYDQASSNFAPFIQGGQGAFSMLSQGLGLPQPQQSQGGGMVQLKAPDGSMKAVPAAQADHFIALGAQRI
jgi:hypothetical protein